MNDLRKTKRELVEEIHSLRAALRLQGDQAELPSMDLEGLLFRQYDSLNSLHQITLDLINQRDIKELLQFIVDEAAKLIDSSYCEILLPEHNELVAKAFTQNTPFPSGNRFTRAEAPLSWKVFDSGVPATVADYSKWPQRNKMFETQNFHAAVSIPILVGRKCIGVLGFARVESGHPFTEEDILSATRFAAIAALAMENSRLYREIEMLATTDELTGIRNCRSLMEIGEREVKRSIRSSIEKMVFNPPVENSGNSTALQMTVSIGVSSLEPEKDTLLELLTRADHALYMAKQTGRNRVCV
jgi:GGDEF domain-containing protein